MSEQRSEQPIRRDVRYYAWRFVQSCQYTLGIYPEQILGREPVNLHRQVQLSIESAFRMGFRSDVLVPDHCKPQLQGFYNPDVPGFLDEVAVMSDEQLGQLHLNDLAVLLVSRKHRRGMPRGFKRKLHDAFDSQVHRIQEVTGLPITPHYIGGLTPNRKRSLQAYVAEWGIDSVIERIHYDLKSHQRKSDDRWIQPLSPDRLMWTFVDDTDEIPSSDPFVRSAPHFLPSREVSAGRVTLVTTAVLLAIAGLVVVGRIRDIQANPASCSMYSYAQEMGLQIPRIDEQMPLHRQQLVLSGEGTSGSGALVRFGDGSVRIVTVQHVIDEDPSMQVTSPSNAAFSMSFATGRFNTLGTPVVIDTSSGPVTDWSVSAPLTQTEVDTLAAQGIEPAPLSEQGGYEIGDQLSVVSRDGAYIFLFEVIPPREGDPDGLIRAKFSAIIGDSCPSGFSLHGPGHSGGLVRDEQGRAIGVVSTAVLERTAVVSKRDAQIVALPEEYLILPIIP